MKDNYTIYTGQVTKSVCKKRQNQIDFYNKDVLDFDKKVWTHLYEKFKNEKIKFFIVAGPGFPK